MAPKNPSTPSPTGLRAPHGATVLEIDWSDGTTSRHEHWLLRGFCPCAHCQGHEGPIRFVENTESLPSSALEIRTLTQVGNYALSLGWGDGHDTGIYTYRFLHELGSLHGLARDFVRSMVTLHS